jgi:L-ascorbate metabolism protein UlaG (beta-lactamase superfamily)
MRHALGLFLVSLAAGVAPQPQELQVRFIGQMAVAVTDGATTLVSDFPYRVGYAGAPPFDRDALRTTTPTIALVTHRHADHWEPELFAGTNWKIVGPADVTGGLPADRVVPLSTRIALGPLQIEPLETPHARIGHYSYLVTWHGRRLYFTGDTESADRLLSTPNLDVAFVSPWLFESVQRRGGRIDAKRVVIYHHQAGQQVAGCAGVCSVPRQNEVIAIR